jgi:hypothetical protein
MEERMTETVLAFDLKVLCADGKRYENVELKVIDEKVIFVTNKNVELKGDSAVTYIDNGNFLVPIHGIEHAIVKYRGQK